MPDFSYYEQLGRSYKGGVPAPQKKKKDMFEAERAQLNTTRPTLGKTYTFSENDLLTQEEQDDRGRRQNLMMDDVAGSTSVSKPQPEPNEPGWIKETGSALLGAARRLNPALRMAADMISPEETTNPVILERRARRDELDPSNGALKFLKDNTIDRAAEAMDRVMFDTGPGKFMSRLGQAAGKVNAATDVVKYDTTTGNKYADIGADALGSIAGYAVNPSQLTQGVGAAYRALNPWVDKAAEKVATKFLPDAGLTLNKAGTEIVEGLPSRMLREGLREGATGAAYALPRSYMQGNNNSLAEDGANMLQEGLMGLGTGPLFVGAGAGIKGIKGAFNGAAERLQQGARKVADRYDVNLDDEIGPENPYRKLGIDRPTEIGSEDRLLAEAGRYTQARRVEEAPTVRAMQDMVNPEGDLDMDPNLVAPKLPRDLRLSKPQYRVGQQAYKINWGSDVDKALYTVASDRNPRSRRDADYLSWLREVFPGKSDNDIRVMGLDIKQSLRNHARAADQVGTDTIEYGDMGHWRPRRAPQAPAPTNVRGSSTPPPVWETPRTDTPTHRVTNGIHQGQEVDISMSDDGTEIHYRSRDGRVRGRVPGALMDNFLAPNNGQAPPQARPQASPQAAPEQSLTRPPAWEATHIVREGRMGGGTPVRTYQDPSYPDGFRYESQDGRVRGRVPFAGYQQHLETIPYPNPNDSLTPEQRYILNELLRAEEESTATRLPGNGTGGPRRATGATVAVNPKRRPPDGEMPPQGPRRSYYDTVEGWESPPQDVLDMIENQTYRRKSMEETKQAARAVGVDQSFEELMRVDEYGNPRMVSDKVVAAGADMVNEFTRRGEREKAALVLERMATGLTESGRAINMAKMYTKLDEFGAKLYGQKIKNLNNEGAERLLTAEEEGKIVKGVEGVKMASNLQDEGNLLFDISDRAKKGDGAIDSHERAQLEFMKLGVERAKRQLNPKKFDPKQSPPKLPKQDSKVLLYLKAEADKAKEQLKKDKNRLSANPFDTYKQYTKIGTYHVADLSTRGVARFADFSAKIIGDVGEPVKDYVRELYIHAIALKNRKEGRKLEDFQKALNAALRGSGMSEDDMLNMRVFAAQLTQESIDMRRAAMGDLQKAFQGLQKPTPLEKAAAFQNIAMLLNPISLGKNAISGLAMLAQESANKAAAMVVDFSRSTITKSERQIYWKTHKKGDWWSNFIKGGKAGWEGVNPDGFETQYELRGFKWAGQKGIINETVGFFEKTLYASMKSFDYANAMFAVNKAMGEAATKEAYRLIKNGGLPKNTNIKRFVDDYAKQHYDELMDIHSKYGKYVTFQDDNALSMLAVKAKRGLNSANRLVGVKDYGWGLGDVVMKFAKTPANLLMRTMEHSPLGVFKAMYTLNQVAKHGGGKAKYTDRDWQMDLGRAITGSLMGAMGWKLAELGIISGGDSGDQKLRNQGDDSGFGNYTVNVNALERYLNVFKGKAFNKDQAQPQKGDMLINYDWFQPFSTMLAGGASFNQKEGNVLTKAIKGADGAATAAINNSFAQGLIELADRQYGESWGDKGANIVAGVPSSFMPGGLRLARRLADNNKREVEYSGGIEGFGKGVKEQFQNNVPVWSRSLPEKRTNLGKEVNYYEEGNPLAKGAQVLLSPSNATRYNPEPSMEKLGELYKETGSKDVLPGKPDKSYSLGDGEDREFTPEQHKQYRKEIQGFTNEYMRYMPDTKGASTREKIAYAARVLQLARESARNKVIIENGLHEK